MINLDEPTESWLPSYSTPGNIIVQVLSYEESPDDSRWSDRYELEVLDYDSGAAPFWIAEGIGIDYWINHVVCPDELTEPGYYVIVNVTGAYYKGEWGFTDDDEEFWYEAIRSATPEELEGLVL